MKFSGQTKWPGNGTGKVAGRKRPRSVVSVVLLVLILCAMSVAVSGRQRPHWIRSYAGPLGPYHLHELAQRYGIKGALDMLYEFQDQEKARQEMERFEKALRRKRELRKKVVELVNASNELYERLNNPSEIHVDTPKLDSSHPETLVSSRRLIDQ